jgi:pSer/pThr/pTyr-binding forkhead associated (FHA) protein
VAATPDPLVLRGTSGPGTGTVIEPTADGITVGREEGPDVEIDDIEVSRSHMELKMLPDMSIEIVDLDSRNGTFVDGDRVSAPHILSGGEIVKTGQTTFVVERRGTGGATGTSARPKPGEAPAE